MRLASASSVSPVTRPPSQTGMLRERPALKVPWALAGLGRDECDDVLDVLQRLRGEGMTVVIIEHTMHAMMRIADRFVVLDHGRVLASGLPRQVVEDRSVIEAYLGKKWAAKQNA